MPINLEQATKTKKKKKHKKEVKGKQEKKKKRKRTSFSAFATHNASNGATRFFPPIHFHACFAGRKQKRRKKQELKR